MYLVCIVLRGSIVSIAISTSRLIPRNVGSKELRPRPPTLSSFPFFLFPSLSLFLSCSLFLSFFLSYSLSFSFSFCLVFFFLSTESPAIQLERSSTCQVYVDWSRIFQHSQRRRMSKKEREWGGRGERTVERERENERTSEEANVFGVIDVSV